MAFPQVEDTDTASGVEGNGVTSHTLTYPTNLANGDLIFAVMCNDGSGSQSGWDTEGFTELGNQFGNSTNGWVVAETYYMISDGTETGNFTITTGVAEESVWRIWRITGWHGTTVPERSNDADGSSTSPDPPSFNPTNWDVEDTLWLTIGISTDTATPVTWDAAPTNYTNLSTQNSGGADGVSMGTARRENATATEDPDSFTISATRGWSCVVAAIRPGGFCNNQRRAWLFPMMSHVVFPCPDGTID